MTDYRIRIIVEGVDNASRPLRGVGSALGGIGTVAGGILSAGALTGIARGIMGMGMQALGATANIQSMEMGIASLAAKEIAMKANTEALAEATKKGMNESEVALMTISDALPQATEKAKAMMEELAQIAIVSPYQLNVVQSSYQMAQAFGYSGEEAKAFTKALLDMGAGVGADNERLGRMAYNLAQIRMVGKVTAIDMRQLSMAGFDLTAVLQYIGKELGLNIKTHEDFNKMLAAGKVNWEQFTTLFAKYAEENFGGAAERMSRTLNGLQSTFSDLMVLTFPKILGPAAETFTVFANSILDGFLKIRDSSILDTLATKINTWVSGITATLSPFVDKFGSLIEAISNVGKPLEGVLELGSGEEAFSGAKGYLTAVANAARPATDEVRKALVNIIGENNMALIERLADTFTHLSDAIRPVVTQVMDFLTQNVKLSDVLTAIGLIIASTVIPALLSAALAFAPFIALVGLIALVRNAWENNWLGMRDTLTAAWQNSILPALQQLWAWLQVNVPIAIQTLVTYWNTTLLPALQTFWSWVQTSLIPALLQIWAWLQVNIPIAIQTLVTIWNTYLLPALQAAWTWIQTSLIPALSALWGWLSTNVPAAIRTLAGFWNNTLYPAIQWVVDFIKNSAIPLWQALANLWDAELTLAGTALAGLWQNVLKPGLEEVGKVLDVTIIPLMENLSRLIKDKVNPEGKSLGSILRNNIKRGIDNVITAIQRLISWLNSLASKIRSIKLPWWLTPGSPTPFELGLRGISAALSDVNKLMQPTFAFSGAAVGSGRVAAPGSVATGGGDINIEMNFYDEGAAAIGMAQVAQLRRKRLGSSMR